MHLHREGITMTVCPPLGGTSKFTSDLLVNNLKQYACTYSPLLATRSFTDYGSANFQVASVLIH
jgi:hypothetical protein